MNTTSRAGSGVLLALLLAITLSHAMGTAFVRPMFQVSDEMVYFAVAQAHAVRQAPTPGEVARLVGGSPGPIDEWVGAKPLYGRMAGTAYGIVAARADPASALVLLRLWGCLALVITVWMGHLVARELCPTNPLVTWGTPLVMALHPVATNTGSGITPDTWANAASAASVLLLLRAVAGRAAWWEVALLYATLTLAIATKDTAYALVASVAVALPGRAWLVWRGHRLRPADGALFAGPLVGALAFAVPALRASLATFYFSPAAREQLVGAPFAFARDLVVTTVRQAPDYFQSFWGELGNFGATPIGLPSHVLVALAIVCVAAFAGAAAWFVAGAAWHPAETLRTTRVQAVVIAAGCLALLMLAPSRQLLWDAADAVQGRWLFPMLAPLVAVGLAGLSWPMRQPVRLLPLVSLLAATLALGALLGGLLPAYYASFPTTYRPEHLFLAGSYGSGLDMARILPFFERPAWLRDPWVAWSPIAGLVVALAAWLRLVYRTATAAPSGDGDLAAYALRRDVTRLPR